MGRRDRVARTSERNRSPEFFDDMDLSKLAVTIQRPLAGLETGSAVQGTGESND